MYHSIYISTGLLSKTIFNAQRPFLLPHFMSYYAKLDEHKSQ